MGKQERFSLLTEHDIYLFKQGAHFRLYEKLGSHPGDNDGVAGTHFAVWAPNARRVAVVGDFNDWAPESHPMALREDESGIWERFIPDVGHGTLYKYHIESAHNDYVVKKGDPFAFLWECPPNTSSVVWDPDYSWTDEEWMRARADEDPLAGPTCVYEMHLGSWMRNPDQPEQFLTYRELAPLLVEYVTEMGFTHVEFLPVMEHPYYGSWGYQSTSYFAPTRRYGTCEDFKFLVDSLHQNGVGVILDWVPSHFATDEHGLTYFDGTHLFEHADTRRGFHPDWKSYIFNYGRNEVRSFLVSSALFWLDEYHADGLRVDAVASMLYLDYSRGEGEWIPNPHGGREDLEAIDFLRTVNDRVHADAPHAMTVAEESTSWPMVSRPTRVGGLGFTMKWNMGWMHDTLQYCALDPVHRKFHQDKLTFSIWYAFAENFMLPLSHDEVVHGKGSLIGKMAGDEWQKFANLRVLLGYMYTHPGKKLLFMGGEFGQQREWNHDQSLDWHLLDNPRNAGLRRWVRDLNTVYRGQHALFEVDFESHGFEWIDCHDAEKSVISFLRRNKSGTDVLAVACNFTPVPRYNYRIGVPLGGYWKEVLNSDAALYGGSGQGNMGGLDANPVSFYGSYDYCLSATLPPLSVLVFRPDATPGTRTGNREKR